MFAEVGVSRKVVVVGAGAVGATFCYALAHSGLADEIALIDQNHDLAQQLKADTQLESAIMILRLMQLQEKPKT